MTSLLRREEGRLVGFAFVVLRAVERRAGDPRDDFFAALLARFADTRFLAVRLAETLRAAGRLPVRFARLELTAMSFSFEVELVVPNFATAKWRNRSGVDQEAVLLCLRF
jgi:hypothetical protein